MYANLCTSTFGLCAKEMRNLTNLKTLRINNSKLYPLIITQVGDNLNQLEYMFLIKNEITNKFTSNTFNSMPNLINLQIKESEIKKFEQGLFNP